MLNKRIVAAAAAAALAAAAPAGASTYDHLDPYTQSSCGQSQSVVASAPITTMWSGFRTGTVYLLWSSRCGTNWAKAYLNDGNPSTDPPVTVTVSGTVPGDAWNYQRTDSFYTEAPGSPIWGNMIYSPGCAKARVFIGGKNGAAYVATGLAVQPGCAPAAG